MFHGGVDANLAQGLKELRRRIERAGIPPSKLDESLNIATWNIREFGKRRRWKESIHHIAEILGQFDVVGVTELRDDLSDLGECLKILGPYWRAVYSDYMADAGGNHERIAYVYDTRMATFTGLAAEAAAPRKKNAATGEYVSEFSWWRSPYIASFRAGNFDFVLITAHIRWGSRAEDRIGPLKLLAEWIDTRAHESHVEDTDIIVMGDFNIPERDDALFQAITSKGLRIPDGLRGAHGTNLAKNKRYDQILHYPAYTKSFTENAGVLDYYAGDFKKLFPGKELTLEKFTYQLSDHLPIWIQMDTDVDGEKLDQIIRDK